jgi:tetraacyldisaccharide 4'-kinase
LNGTAAVPFSDCLDYKILASAGIADPESFFAGLRGKGMKLVQTIHLPDHVVYTQKWFDEITEAMRTSGAQYLITTEKDGVKLKGVSPELSSRILLARMELTVNNPVILKGMLNKLLEPYQVHLSQ